MQEKAVRDSRMHDRPRYRAASATGVSQRWVSGMSPLMMPKNCFWMAAVTGPRSPSPDRDAVDRAGSA